MGRTDQTVKPDRTETTEQPVNREHRDQMVLPVLPAKTEMREQPVNVENPPSEEMRMSRFWMYRFV